MTHEQKLEMQEKQFQFDLVQTEKKINFDVQLHLERKIREEVLPTLYKKLVIAKSYAFNKKNISIDDMTRTMFSHLLDSKNYWSEYEIFFESDKKLKNLVKKILLDNITDVYAEWKKPNETRNFEVLDFKKETSEKFEEFSTLVHKRIFEQYKTKEKSRV
ncbi:hypothetical protein CR194_05170 [Salipaludibacillus keqinensis]|uniref:Uncharacterized protein n=1 Tax=Salipaludibacillus keqinensis TaxID=2045207 RepID=A0A323TZA3_9BACI|nr:hypothetical protein [Salipaludibacillus keqinensis]PYZ94915.1 hypothetical protein CR194_05170 [Salipaludibacillus keqinensis]